MDIPIRSTRTEAEAKEWAVVLTALRIPHRIEIDGDEWIVVVPEAAAGRGRAALRAHDAEVRPQPEQILAEAAPGRAAWITGFAAGASLLAFFLATGPSAGNS